MESFTQLVFSGAALASESYPAVAPVYAIGTTNDDGKAARPRTPAEVFAAAFPLIAGNGPPFAYIPLPPPGSPDRPLRVNLVLTGFDEDTTGSELLYYVIPVSYGGGAAALAILKIGEHVATWGSVGLSASGGPAGLNWSKGSVFTSAGVLEALTGGALAPKVIPGEPSGVSVPTWPRRSGSSAS
jgi:hypothetical protein